MKYLLPLLLLPCLVRAQIPDSVQKKIDHVFRAFGAKTPGCVVAVLKDDEIIFKKGYGMANLEYGIPNQPNTIFHIASESKQYVAFCMLLLEQQGKLTVDDDIRKHLDFVPDFGTRITIRQLIHHTSGLRDWGSVAALTGWARSTQFYTNADALEIIARQKHLNHKPGDE
ncbi:MAG: class C beta-lactamase-related serine hydrolase, partial [Chitinophagaceae bacterium]